jgi:hypothetical protein
LPVLPLSLALLSLPVLPLSLSLLLLMFIRHHLHLP